MCEQPTAASIVRVLEIVADGAPGGGTTAVLGLCADLLSCGGHVVSLVTQRGSYAAEQGRALGLNIYELDFFRSRFDPRVREGIRRIIADVQPNIVHAHGARAALPLSTLGRRDEKRAYTVHGYHFTHKSLIARRLAQHAEARIARDSDCGIFVSEADLAIARRHGILFDQSTLIYNGVLLEDLPADYAQEKTHDLIFSARMHPQKNPLFLIDVMGRLAKTGVRLAIVGGGSLEAEVRAATKKHGLGAAIDFYGALPRAEAIKRVRSARLFLLPSLWEGLPIAPIEAMACGVPVVGSDIPGTDEVVSNGVTGNLIRGFNADLWATQIKKLLDTPALIAAMAIAGRADVERRFTRKKSSAAHRAVYASLAAGSSLVV